MRRRTRPRVVWLPQTNANSVGANVTQAIQLVAFGLAGGTGEDTTIEIPLVADAQIEAFDANTVSLSDIESSGYRLRRIVGKIWVQMDQVAADTLQSAVITAGIIVRRAESSSGQSIAFQAGEENISAAAINNTGDPWVWRRSWWLGNNSQTSLPGNATSFPELNFAKEYPGGIAEGPHVDQKTARVVSREERLFLNITGTVVGEAAAPPGTSVTIAVLTDLRILGSLITSSGNRGNSSR